MRTLLDFLIRYSSWLVFVFFTVVSCLLLFTFNPYQHHIYLTSAGAVSSSVYRLTNNVTSYFSLRDINEDLQLRNAGLEQEVIVLKQQIVALQEQTLLSDSSLQIPALQRYSFIIAHVINNSVNRSHNYITIEKGSKDGVRPEMGVVDQNGVVGIVNLVGEHTSRVISLLNPYLRISCKVKGSDQIGSLQWDGRTFREAVLEELPRHTVFASGDTIVTSGYSSAFPEGIPVGTIIGKLVDNDENFFNLRIRLFTDFSTLSTVRVVKDALTDELNEVEQDITIKSTIN
ncbi:MAG: rod shape-determining protein MreC [Muribaculaceae bacterium]|nr:rod shape-determining protein MreC [Muribaculaceae bacterium]